MVRPTIPEIAKKLNVNYILEGSGQKYGNKFVLRVQLIAGHNEKHLWGKSYDKEIKVTSDIVGIQSEIAQLIAAELKTSITPEEKQLIEKAPTLSITAYDLCKRADEVLRNLPWPVFDSAAVKRAEVLYTKSLEYDPTFTNAYVGLAFIYMHRIDRDLSISNFDILESYCDSTLFLANKVLSYDNRSYNGYYIRGTYYSRKGNNKQAIEDFEKAILCNPNSWYLYQH